VVIFLGIFGTPVRINNLRRVDVPIVPVKIFIVGHERGGDHELAP
jgi:uncharacterized membrane protein YccF (DUF307 family)